jgi:hypothetical protein
MIQPQTAYTHLTCCEKIIKFVTCGKKKYHHKHKPTEWEVAHFVHVRGTSILNDPNRGLPIMHDSREEKK